MSFFAHSKPFPVKLLTIYITPDLSRYMFEALSLKMLFSPLFFPLGFLLLDLGAAMQYAAMILVLEDAFL